MANATPEGVKLEIADIAHWLIAPVNTMPTAAQIAKFEFGKPASYPTGFEWVGDMSSESLIEYGQDGGEATTLRTHSRKGVRTQYSEESYTVELSGVNRSKEMYEIAYPNGKYVSAEKAYDVYGETKSIEKATLFIVHDEGLYYPIYHPRVSYKGSLPVFSLEYFTELPIKGTILPGTKNLVHRFFDPVTPAPAAS